MSVQFDHGSLETAQKVYTAEELYRMGIEASTPGVGDETDLVSAHQWFNLAAMRGNELAREYRQQLTLEMTSKEVAEAQRRARRWLDNCRTAIATP